MHQEVSKGSELFLNRSDLFSPCWRPDRCFDLNTCVHGLHYVGDKLALIARATSWLVGEGLFVANLDLANVKLSDGGVAARWVAGDLRRSLGL